MTRGQYLAFCAVATIAVLAFLRAYRVDQAGWPRMGGGNVSV